MTSKSLSQLISLIMGQFAMMTYSIGQGTIDCATHLLIVENLMRHVLGRDMFWVIATFSFSFFRKSCPVMSFQYKLTPYFLAVFLL